MESIGENLRRVCDFGYYPSWSPDGRKLFGLFSPKQGKVYRGLYSFETGKSRAVADLTADAVPNWLADSNRVIYSHENKIFLSDITTEKYREILSIPQEKIVNVGINRENNLIYFTVAKTESDIWLLDASGSQ